MDDELKRYREATEERPTERMRDMQIELLGGKRSRRVGSCGSAIIGGGGPIQSGRCAIRARRDSGKKAGAN